MLFLNLFCVSITKVCPKVSEKPKIARKGVTFSIKLDIIKYFNCGEQNKDIECSQAQKSTLEQKFFHIK